YVHPPTGSPHHPLKFDPGWLPLPAPVVGHPLTKVDLCPSSLPEDFWSDPSFFAPGLMWPPPPPPTTSQPLPPPPPPLEAFTETKNSILRDQNDLLRLAEAFGTVSSSQEFSKDEQATLALLLKQCASLATRTLEDCNEQARLSFHETRDLASDLL